MSRSTHQIALKGVDQTGAAFNSIQSRAAAASGRIARVMGGAIAAAGAFLSVRAISDSVQELGRLSDVAQKANTSVSDLNAASRGLSILGIQGASMEHLASSFALMEKNTGKSGLSGFYETIGEIAKIPDQAERAKVAVKAFGRSGLDFMPPINGAKNGTAALQGVIAAYRTELEGAAKAGDDLADATNTIVGKIRDLWLKGVGKISEKLTGAFPASARQAAAEVSAYLEFAARNVFDVLENAWLRLKTAFTSVGAAIGAAIGGVKEKLFGSGGDWREIGKMIADAFNYEWEKFGNDDADFKERVAKRAEDLRKQLEAASKLQGNYENATGGADSGTDAGGPAATAAANILGDAAAKAAQRISNQLIIGGSAAAQRLSLLGPEYQNEAKKQTKILEDIREELKSNSDTPELSVTDLGI